MKKRFFVLALRDVFDESKSAINIQLQDMGTGEKFGFRTLTEFQAWLHGVANRGIQGNSQTAILRDLPE
jgi:hypothetical protein